MTIQTSQSEAAHQEEERLEEWLGHPERREQLDATDPLLPASNVGQEVGIETPRSGLLSGLYRAFYSAVAGRWANG